jgi:hypothetical protein
MTNRNITSIEIPFSEVDQAMEARVSGSYSDLDGLNQAFRSIRDSQDHDAYCKTDVSFVWSDGETETVRFDIYGKKAGRDPSFELIVGQWINRVDEAIRALKQGRSVAAYATQAEAEAHIVGLHELFTAVCEYKAEITATAAPESDAGKTIAALRAELATSQDNLAAEERSSGALQEQLDESTEMVTKFLATREQLRALRGMLDGMNLDA